MRGQPSDSCHLWQALSGPKTRSGDGTAAYQQLLQYRKDLEPPPLLVICDLGRCAVQTNVNRPLPWGNVVRFIPPLIVTDNQMGAALEIVGQPLAAAY
ncbi:MAG: hypothetical protein M3Y74_24020 [Chloroflexota bacterium]|nr:hypothetical protein [Chloroflexota bacterium]